MAFNHAKRAARANLWMNADHWYSYAFKGKVFDVQKFIHSENFSISAFKWILRFQRKCQRMQTSDSMGF